MTDLPDGEGQETSPPTLVRGTETTTILAVEELVEVYVCKEAYQTDSSRGEREMSVRTVTEMRVVVQAVRAIVGSSFAVTIS